MEALPFSARACVRYGWETFKKRPGILIGATAIVLVVNAVMPSPKADTYGMALAISIGILTFAVSILTELCMTHFALRAHDSIESVELANLWHPEPFWRYLGAALLAGVIIIVGLILLIVPGIIAMLALAFVAYLVVDQDLRPVAALKESARLTKGYRWKLFQLGLLLILINLLGLICLVVGLLVSLPVSRLAMAHAYRTLQKRPATDAGAVAAASVPVTGTATDNESQ